MEVSSFANLNDSNSDSRSRSPNRGYGSLRCRYYDGYGSSSRSLRRYDRGYSPRIDYSSDRDYHNSPPDRDDNYCIMQHSLSYYGRRYGNSTGFSPVRNYSQDHYPNPNHNRQGQGRFQGGNQESNTNRYNNEGNG